MTDLKHGFAAATDESEYAEFPGRLGVADALSRVIDGLHWCVLRVAQCSWNVRKGRMAVGGGNLDVEFIRLFYGIQ